MSCHVSVPAEYNEFPGTSGPRSSCHVLSHVVMLVNGGGVKCLTLTGLSMTFLTDIDIASTS